MSLAINGKKISSMSRKEIKKTYKMCFFGLPFLIAGLFMFFFLGSEQFTCNRLYDVCHFQKRHLWETSFKTRESIPLSSIKNAHVKERVSHHDGKTSYTYRVILKTDQGDKKLFQVGTNNKEKHYSYMQRINIFLNHDAEELVITTHESIFFFFVLGIPTLIIGFFFSFFLFYRLRKRLKELDNQKIIIR